MSGMRSVVLDTDLVHGLIVDGSGTACGIYIPHKRRGMAQGARAITCMECLFPRVERNCGHKGTELRLCAMSAFLQARHRCLCCQACFDKCLEDT